jgi:hypothetical protein
METFDWNQIQPWLKSEFHLVLSDRLVLVRSLDKALLREQGRGLAADNNEVQWNSPHIHHTLLVGTGSGVDSDNQIYSIGTNKLLIGEAISDPGIFQI